MKKITTAILALLIALTTASCHTDISDAELQKITPDVAPPHENVDTLEPITSLADFCIELQRITAKASDGSSNTLISPLSAYFALGMLKEGADGDTLAQFEAAMGPTEHGDMLALTAHLTNLDGTALNIANSVWVDMIFEPKQEYLDALASAYLAEGYKAQLKYAEPAVNLWIEEHTNGLIRDMLDETALDDSVMALVNTLYMNAKWAKPFSAEATHERAFNEASGGAVQTEFMFRKSYFDVIEADEFIGVSLPYSDGSLKFVALMPKDTKMSMTDMLSMIDESGGWAELSKDAVSEEIKLYLPKFEHKSALSLTEILKEMGVVDAFDMTRADFGKIADKIFLGGIMQNAVIKVDEAGTEAAAATVATIAPTSAAPSTEPRTIEFNRPFVFAVVDTVSGAVLFAGEHNSAR